MFCVSSAAPEKMVEAWVSRNDIYRYVSHFFGSEWGSKEEHVRFLHSRYPAYKIIYVSDSLPDMALGNVAIGIAPHGKELKFYDAGAAAVIHSFPEILGKDLTAM